MNNRKDQREQSMQDILEATLALVRKNGFVATNTIDIAKKAGVSNGLIFSHFKTRDGLIQAVISDFESRYIKKFNSCHDPLGNLQKTLESHLEAIKEDEKVYTWLILENHTLPSQSRAAFLMCQNTINTKILASIANNAQGKTAENKMLLITWNALVTYFLTNHDLYAPKGSVVDEKGKEIMSFFLAIAGGKENEKMPVMRDDN